MLENQRFYTSLPDSKVPQAVRFFLEKKIFLDKNDKKRLKFSNRETQNELTQKSFVEKSTTLLRGVTGSRKTEINIPLQTQNIQNGGQIH